MGVSVISVYACAIVLYLIFFICHAYPAAFYAKNKLNMDRKASPEDERV